MSIPTAKANPYRPLLDELRATFESNASKSLEWRKDALRSLLRMFTEGDNLRLWIDARISDLGGGEERVDRDSGVDHGWAVGRLGE